MSSCTKRFFIAVCVLFVWIVHADEVKKSALVYYGEDLSYYKAARFDYIITQPYSLDTSAYGFSLYKERIYVYVSIGELDKDTKAYAKLRKEWIRTQNKAWKSVVLDIRDEGYQKFLFEEIIEPLKKRGFVNFFFDTLDSYSFYAKSKADKKECEAALASFIEKFHTRYPKSKLIINRGFEIIPRVHDDITALLFESYYRGIDVKDLSYKKVSKEEREWLDAKLSLVRRYHKDIIAVDYLPLDELAKEAPVLVKKLAKRGFIPYVSTKDLDIYGYSTAP